MPYENCLSSGKCFQNSQTVKPGLNQVFCLFVLGKNISNIKFTILSISKAQFSSVVVSTFKLSCNLQTPFILQKNPTKRNKTNRKNIELYIPQPLPVLFSQSLATIILLSVSAFWNSGKVFIFLTSLNVYWTNQEHHLEWSLSMSKKESWQVCTWNRDEEDS